MSRPQLVAGAATFQEGASWVPPPLCRPHSGLGRGPSASRPRCPLRPWPREGQVWGLARALMETGGHVVPAWTGLRAAARTGPAARRPRAVPGLGSRTGGPGVCLGCPLGHRAGSGSLTHPCPGLLLPHRCEDPGTSPHLSVPTRPSVPARPAWWPPLLRCVLSFGSSHPAASRSPAPTGRPAGQQVQAPQRRRLLPPTRAAWP